MSEMRMALEAFASGELDYAALQRRIAEELAVGYSVDDALAELHGICESDGMSQGLYNVLRRAITRVGVGEDTDPFPSGETRPHDAAPLSLDTGSDEPTDPDLPAMFTNPGQLLPDELPPDPLMPTRKATTPPEIVLPADEELATRPIVDSTDASLGADAIVTGATLRDRQPQPPPDRPPASLPESGDVIADRYVVQSIIGKGGTAVVYRVLDRAREACEPEAALVALKMLKPELQARAGSDRKLLLEALQGQRFAHPHLVRILDVGIDHGRAFVTMELLDGELLQSALARRTPEGFPGDEGLAIVAGIGRGLAYLHQRGYVHSDLKPRNVFLTSEGQPKLLDFGLSRRPGRALEPVLDGGEMPARTPAYASPQILRGEAPGYRDDVFSLACLATELLSGRHPFGRVPADQARERKLRPARARGVTAYQQRTLGRALSFRAARRPPDAGAFLRDMGLVEERARESGPGFLQGALLGLGAGLLLTLAIISPEGPLQRLLSRVPEGSLPAPETTRPMPDTAASEAPQPAQRSDGAAPGRSELRGVSPGGTFSPDEAGDPTGVAQPGEASVEPPDRSAASSGAEQDRSANSDTTSPGVAAADAAEPVATPLSSDAAAPSEAATPATLPDAAAARAPGRLAFETGSYEVDESSAVLIARVIRSGGTDGEVAFRWRTLGGSAAPDEDFIATDWQRTEMADGQTSTRIFVPLVNDGLGEGPESFSIELADPEGGVRLADVTLVRVIIRDDDRR